MKRQRGITNGWLYLIGLIIILALLAAIGYGIKSYLDGVDAKAYQRGKQETEAAYAKRDNQALREANAEIQKLNDAARAHEHADAEALAKIDQQRAKDAKNAEDKRKRDVADARSGALGMRDPGQVTRCAAASGLSPGPAAKPGAGVSDGDAAGGLSREAVQFLLVLADDADDVAKQLASAQAVIRQDRVTCGGR